MTRRTEYSGASCTPPASLPADANETRFAYGLQRQVATGYAVPLAATTRALHSSALGGTCSIEADAAFDPLADPSAGPGCAGEYRDYSQAARAIDPTGYVCAPSALPATNVVCRSVSLGYVTGVSGPVRDRLVTFFSYDSRGRPTRAYGPVSLDRASPSDPV